MTDEWSTNEEKRVVTTEELDELVKSLRVARDEYDLASTLSSEKHSIVKEIEGKLIDTLLVANKNNYEVDGIARVSVVTKSQVTTPKTIEQKEALFKWIERRMGREALVAYQSINYATLNSLYNQEMNEAIAKGLQFDGIDGLDLPMVVRSLSMRAK